MRRGARIYFGGLALALLVLFVVQLYKGQMWDTRGSVRTTRAQSPGRFWLVSSVHVGFIGLFAFLALRRGPSVEPPKAGD
jgi:hypothetical protein